MVRRAALVRKEVSEERSSSIIRVTRVGELGTTLPVISNRRRMKEILCENGRVSMEYKIVDAERSGVSR
jgi:hypothetical protein